MEPYISVAFHIVYRQIAKNFNFRRIAPDYVEKDFLPTTRVAEPKSALCEVILKSLSLKATPDAKDMFDVSEQILFEPAENKTLRQVTTDRPHQPKLQVCFRRRHEFELLEPLLARHPSRAVSMSCLGASGSRSGSAGQ